MISLRLLLGGAALAAGIHYITKKRPDGSSMFEDLKAKAPELMDKAKPYVERLKGEFDRLAELKGSSAGTKQYPQKFENNSPEPTSEYRS